MKMPPLESKLTFNQTNEFIESVQRTLEDEESQIKIDMSSYKLLNSVMFSGLIRSFKIHKQHQGRLLLSSVLLMNLQLFKTTNILKLFTIQNSEK